MTGAHTRAALTVCRHSADTAEARQILDMLGLIDGGQLVPDPDGTGKHGRDGHDVVLAERPPASSTAPAGLLGPADQPPAASTAAVATKTPTKKKGTPKPPAGPATQAPAATPPVGAAPGPHAGPVTGRRAPDAAPHVSPSRSHEEDGELGASDAPAELPPPADQLIAAGVADPTETPSPPRSPIALLPSEPLLDAAMDYIDQLEDTDVEPPLAEPTPIRKRRKTAAAAAPTDGDDVVAVPVLRPVATPEPAADRPASSPVEKPDTVPQAAASRAVDVLAVGLEHPHPAVRARAKVALRAIDSLCTALARSGGRRG